MKNIGTNLNSGSFGATPGTVTEIQMAKMKSGEINKTTHQATESMAATEL